MTDSEELFEQFCKMNGLHCERVPTASEDEEQRPDCRVTGLRETTIVVEIKQFDPNPEEENAIKKMSQGQMAGFRSVPGDRLRRAIRKADGQIKTLSQGKHPGLLIVCDTYALNHTHDYHVLTAMRGLDVIPILVDPQGKDIFLPKRPGSEKMLTAAWNTSISAIGAFRRRKTGEVGLDIYHNKHAHVPLFPAEIAGATVQHFRMSDDENGWDPLDHTT